MEWGRLEVEGRPYLHPPDQVEGRLFIRSYINDVSGGGFIKRNRVEGVGLFAPNHVIPDPDPAPRPKGGDTNTAPRLQGGSTLGV